MAEWFKVVWGRFTKKKVKENVYRLTINSFRAVSILSPYTVWFCNINIPNIVSAE